MNTQRLFAVEKHKGCLRGLHWLYTPTIHFDEQALAGHLMASHSQQLVTSEEPLGKRVVHRLVYQFRFELRIGGRLGEIAFLHRMTASPAHKSDDRQWFEEQLSHVLRSTSAMTYRL